MCNNKSVKDQRFGRPKTISKNIYTNINLIEYYCCKIVLELFSKICLSNQVLKNPQKEAFKRDQNVFQNLQKKLFQNQPNPQSVLSKSFPLKLFGRTIIFRGSIVLTLAWVSKNILVKVQKMIVLSCVVLNYIQTGSFGLKMGVCRSIFKLNLLPPYSLHLQGDNIRCEMLTRSYVFKIMLTHILGIFESFHVIKQMFMQKINTQILNCIALILDAQIGVTFFIPPLMQ